MSPTSSVLLSKNVQLRVLWRDHWTCQRCGRPVVFAPALRLIERMAQAAGHQGPLAFFDPLWRGERAPLLALLGAVVERADPRAGPGEDERDFLTACAQCSLRGRGTTSPSVVEERRSTPTSERPDQWDGMSSVFAVLARTYPDALDAREQAWIEALTTDDAPSLRMRIGSDSGQQQRGLPLPLLALVQTIRTMLPEPIVGEATLVGGDPGEVIVHVTPTKIDVMEYSVEWTTRGRAVIFGILVASFDVATAKPDAIAAAIVRARARRLASHRWCARCQTVQPPEWITESGCGRCEARM